MICPNCKYEYQPGIKKCPDCGAALVDHLPADAGDPKMKFAELGEVSDEIQSGMLSGMLEENDIEYFVRNNFFPNSRIVVSDNPKRGIGSFFVDASKEKEAKEIYEDFKTIIKNPGGQV